MFHGMVFRFKLHLIINNKGEIFNFMFTHGNVDVREPLNRVSFWRISKGNYAHARDISDRLYLKISFFNGIQLVTKVKSNMKNSFMSIADKELAIKLLNEQCLEYSICAMFFSLSLTVSIKALFLSNILSAIAAYCFLEKKPAIDINFINDGQLAIF